MYTARKIAWKTEAMTSLTVTVPESSLSALRRSPNEFATEMKLAAAIHWYARGLISQERAAELAGLNRRDFIRALVRDGVDVFVVDQDSLARELAAEAGD
jgi:predicted HTH domain antitoxin